MGFGAKNRMDWIDWMIPHRLLQLLITCDAKNTEQGRICYQFGNMWFSQERAGGGEKAAMEERLEKMQKEVGPIPIMHRIFAFHVPQTYYREFSFESVLL